MKVVIKILILIPSLYLIIMPVYLSHITESVRCGGIVISINDSLDYHLVSKSEIAGLISQKGTKIIGQPVIDLPIGEIESRISQLRELKEVEVYTTIDGLLHVSVNQRDPIMRVIAGGGDYFVDEDGVVIRRRGLYTPRLHIVSGNVRITGQMLNGVSVLDSSIKHSILKDIYWLV
jgi:cell division protein FtsQ